MEQISRKRKNEADESLRFVPSQMSKDIILQQVFFSPFKPLFRIEIPGKNAPISESEGRVRIRIF